MKYLLCLKLFYHLNVRLMGHSDQKRVWMLDYIQSQWKGANTGLHRVMRITLIPQRACLRIIQADFTCRCLTKSLSQHNIMTLTSPMSQLSSTAVEDRAIITVICGHAELYDGTYQDRTKVVSWKVSEEGIAGKFWRYVSAQHSPDQYELHSGNSSWLLSMILWWHQPFSME